jgi:AcrR family transcriptional regulator/transcriptional regulator with XRE-family HTH domain
VANQEPIERSYVVFRVRDLHHRGGDVKVSSPPGWSSCLAESNGRQRLQGAGVHDEDGDLGRGPSTDTAIGLRVRAARMRQGVSLRALSRDLDVSPGTMSQVETGKTRLSVVRLHQIAAALGMTPDEVLVVPLDGPLDGAEPPDDAGPAVVSAVGPLVTDWRVYGSLNFDPVLEAALTVFVRTGYHGASVREVARECRRSVSGIYHHYPSKQAMLRAILDIGVAEMLDRAERARAEGRDPVERFSLMIESLVLFHTHRREVAFVGASEMRSLDPAARREIADRRMVQQHMIDEEALAAAAVGDFRTPYPKEAARAVVTMCTSIAQWFKPDGPLTPEDLVEQYVDFAVNVMNSSGAAPATVPSCPAARSGP